MSVGHKGCRFKQAFDMLSHEANTKTDKKSERIMLLKYCMPLTIKHNDYRISAAFLC